MFLMSLHPKKIHGITVLEYRICKPKIKGAPKRIVDGNCYQVITCIIRQGTKKFVVPNDEIRQIPKKHMFTVDINPAQIPFLENKEFTVEIVVYFRGLSHTTKLEEELVYDLTNEEFKSVKKGRKLTSKKKRSSIEAQILED